MAKREISSTLRNLKFMQRAALKEEKPKKEEEEVLPAGEFPSACAVKRCVVIVEGDPHPGATRGRMSFLNFNPSIDKLNEEESNPHETAATSSGRQNDATSVRENGSSQYSSDKLDPDYSNGDLKRKKAEPEPASEAQDPNNNDEDKEDSFPNSSRRSQKQQKRGKLDWSVLRPPKHQSKRK